MDSESIQMGFPGGSAVKNLPANARDRGSIPGSGRSSGEGNGNPPQYLCLGNAIDRGPGGIHGVIVRHDLLTKQQYLHTHTRAYTQYIHSVCLCVYVFVCVVTERQRIKILTLGKNCTLFTGTYFKIQDHFIFFVTLGNLVYRPQVELPTGDCLCLRR